MAIKFTTISSIYFIIIFFAIGFPVWYFTTTPSRYALPDVSSLMVHSQTIIHRVLISVIDVTNQLNRISLKAKLTSDQISQDGSIVFQYQWLVRQMTQEEKIKWDSTNHSLHGLDLAWSELDSHKVKGKLFVALVDLKLINKLSKEKFVFGSFRTVFVGVNFDDEISVTEEDLSLDEIIIKAVTIALQGETHLDESMKLQNEAISSKESIKKLLKREIDVIINIIPEDIDDGLKLVQSNKIKQLHQLTDYVFLHLSGVIELLNIKVMSQMVYYCFPKDFIQNNLERSSDQRLLSTDKVAELLTFIESRLIEPNNQQSFYLNVIIPSSRYNSSLLFTHSETGQKSFSILTSYSSGIFFWNNQEQITLAFKSFMRNLIGLPSLQASNSLKKDIFFSQMELDQIMRRITLDQLSSTLLSLESIQKLIMKVQNIVIIEEVANKLNSAVKLSHQSIESLGKNDLKKAFDLSSKAFLASESAFFDPSLLSLHYFPEDQKYAVYFPLFLPVSLPLLSSFYHLIKFYITSSKSQVTES